MRREDAFMGGQQLPHTSAARLARDLVGLMRINSAISAVRGLVALERPLIELLAEILPATRGALILTTDPDEIPAVEREGVSGNARRLPVSRAVIERARELVGVLADAPMGAPGEVNRRAPDRCWPLHWWHLKRCWCHLSRV